MSEETGLIKLLEELANALKAFPEVKEITIESRIPMESGDVLEVGFTVRRAAPPEKAAETFFPKAMKAEKAKPAPKVDRRGKRWSESEVKLLKKLRARGLTAKQIAERLGRTPSAVMAKLHRSKGVRRR